MAVVRLGWWLGSLTGFPGSGAGLLVCDATQLWSDVDTSAGPGAGDERDRDRLGPGSWADPAWL